MPHVHQRPQPSNPGLPPPPVYMVYTLCQCGNIRCMQPILVNGHQMQALRAAGIGGVDFFPEPVPTRELPYVLSRFAMPHRPVEARPNNLVAVPDPTYPGGQRFEYPSYPDVQPREYGRLDRERRRRRHQQQQINLNYDSDSDIDR